MGEIKNTIENVAKVLGEAEKIVNKRGPLSPREREVIIVKLSNSIAFLNQVVSKL